MDRYREIAETAVNEFRALQKPDEFAQLLMLADKLEPDIIVEIGCAAGGSLYGWREICDEVYGIDLPGVRTPGSHAGVEDHGATVFVGDSRHPETVDWLKQQLDGRGVDVLFIDAGHEYDEVHSDYDLYSPFVRDGGMIAFHDVLKHTRYDLTTLKVEVHVLWAELTKDRTGLVIASDPRDWGGIGIL